MYKIIVCFIFLILTGCGGGSSGGASSSNASGTNTGGTNTGGTSPTVTGFEVVSSNVPDGSMAVDPRAIFQLEFNASFGVSGITTDQVLLSDGKTNYPLSIVPSGGTLRISPATPLHTRTDYQLVIKSGVTSANGSVLKSDYVLKFRTTMFVFEKKQLLPSDRSVYGGSDMPRIIIVDVNGDGRPDLVELGALYRPDLPSANGYTVNIYLQNTSGGFDQFQKLENVSDQSPYQKYFNNLIALDIDGDSKPELLVPEYRPDDSGTAGIRVYKAGADGKFAAHAFISTNYSEKLQALDVDGDGRMDLVGSNRRALDQVTGGFQVLRNTTAGFQQLDPVSLPNSRYEFGVTDLDGDGKRELIVNRGFAKPSDGTLTNEVLIYSQRAAGVFSLNSQLTTEAMNLCSNASACEDMRIVDLNGDGKAELVFNTQISGSNGMEVAVIGFSRRSESGLVKIFQISIGSNMRVYEIRDMDGDSVPDLFVVSLAGSFSIIGGNANISWDFFNKLNIPVFDSMYPANVAIGDIDGDGRPDVIFDSYNSGIVMARQVKY